MWTEAIRYIHFSQPKILSHSLSLYWIFFSLFTLSFCHCVLCVRDSPDLCQVLMNFKMTYKGKEKSKHFTKRKCIKYPSARNRKYSRKKKNNFPVVQFLQVACHIKTTRKSLVLVVSRQALCYIFNQTMYMYFIKCEFMQLKNLAFHSAFQVDPDVCDDF